MPRLNTTSLASNTPIFRSVANRTELTVKNVIKVIFASAFVLSIAAPAFAQSPGHGYRTAVDQQINRLKSTATRRVQKAFAMESGFRIQIDPNDPVATGGSSLGYNQMLLQY
jgi:hypothetical protein